MIFKAKHDIYSAFGVYKDFSKCIILRPGKPPLYNIVVRRRLNVLLRERLIGQDIVRLLVVRLVLVGRKVLLKLPLLLLVGLMVVELLNLLILILLLAIVVILDGRLLLTEEVLRLYEE